jgi:hypothetical protein
MTRRQVKGLDLRITVRVIFPDPEIHCPVRISVPWVRIMDPERNLFTLWLQIILTAVDVYDLGKHLEKLSSIALV